MEEGKGLERERERDSYLAGAHFVERDEGERLRQHGGRQVLLGHDEGDEHAGEQQLREERHGLDAQGRGAREGRGQVQEDVVGAEVVPMVDAGDVVEEGVFEERLPIADRFSLGGRQMR